MDNMQQDKIISVGAAFVELLWLPSKHEAVHIYKA
jgi:hypothetical protein